jgi:hypothetical protein
VHKKRQLEREVRSQDSFPCSAQPEDSIQMSRLELLFTAQQAIRKRAAFQESDHQIGTRQSKLSSLGLVSSECPGYHMTQHCHSLICFRLLHSISPSKLSLTYSRRFLVRNSTGTLAILRSCVVFLSPPGKCKENTPCIVKSCITVTYEIKFRSIAASAGFSIRILKCRYVFQRDYSPLLWNTFIYLTL